MADFLAAYSIQNWLESCPQGYLDGTRYGHAPGTTESELILDNEVLRQDAIFTTVQLVAGERCALAASSGLVNAAPDEDSKLFLATQTLDEARHVEIFKRRLLDLGVKKSDIESTIQEHANPNLVKFAEVLLEKVDKKDFIAGVVGQNIVLEGMAFTVFEMVHMLNQQVNPAFAQILSGTIADERRHVGFGENRIGSLIKEHPEKRQEVEAMQKEMTYYMLAAFADVFKHAQQAIAVGREVTAAAAEGEKEHVVWKGTDFDVAPVEELEATLGGTVLKEFKTRLARVGIEYQSPNTPSA
jgi:1,2-phenylacetyl-CoA epoxidase catalytic subunit